MRRAWGGCSRIEFLFRLILGIFTSDWIVMGTEELYNFQT